jgi:hypothetical protein
MKKIIFTLIVTILFIAFGCKKNKDNQPLIDISGFIINDALGNPLGVIGQAGDDWKILDWSRLTDLEKSFLDFPDNVDLTNTSVTTLGNAVAFPNPFYNVSAIQFISGDSVKIKIAVVDSSGQRLKTYAGKFMGPKVYYFDFSRQDSFPSGKSLRYYFSFSATAQQNFKAGYGDVKVCRAPGGTPYTECF